MAELVDLSLFAVSPTNDSHFALNDEHVEPPPPSYRSTHMRARMPIPGRRYHAPSLEPQYPSSNAAPRSVFDRMKRVRSDAVLPAPSKLEERRRPERSLQQRRHHEALTHSLTIPTTPSPSTAVHPQIPRTAVSATLETQRAGVPMIWLPNEEMWLISDATPERHTELYGYYAPALHSDPGPWESSQPNQPSRQPEVYEEPPPSYSSAVASAPTRPTSTELSPVRSQFLSLMDTNRSQPSSYAIQPCNEQLTARPQQEPTRRRQRSQPSMGVHQEEIDYSPMFQEAISGVGFGIPFDGPSSSYSSKNVGRRDSWSNDLSGYVSPLSPESQDSRWRIRRATSARV